MTRGAALAGLALSALLVACTDSDLGAPCAEARAELERGHAAQAERICNVALLRADISASDMHRWQLQWTRLRALAQAGRGADAVLNLMHLDMRDSDRVAADRIGMLLRDTVDARDMHGALELLAFGRRRFPDHARAWDEFEQSDQAFRRGLDLELLRGVSVCTY